MLRSMEPCSLLPNLVNFRINFPRFDFIHQRKNEHPYAWVTRMANHSGDCPEWKYQLINTRWRCIFYMKKVMIASCFAEKKKTARNKTSELALENLRVACSGGGVGESVADGIQEVKVLVKQERQASDESCAIEGGDELSDSFVEQNILEIQRKILSNQVLISDSIKCIDGSGGMNLRNASPEDPHMSYYNNHVVRVENSIIMKQNIILGCVGSFSASQNVKHYSDYQRYEEQCYLIAYQSEILGTINKSNSKKVPLHKEELNLTQASEELRRRKPLLVNQRMIGEKWNRIIENQSSMLDNLLDIMCTLCGMTPNIENKFEMLNKDNHACFLGNIATTYKYKIHFHENEISAMLNDIMSSHHSIVNDQRKIIENEGKILKAFNYRVFTRDFVLEMSDRVPFLDNELYALQLRTWAGMNHLLAELNQVCLDRIDKVCGNDDMVNYQSEVLANQKNILANLSRFPGTQNAIMENQGLILNIQDEVLSHYIPATNNNEPLGEDNIGFKLLKSLGWSGGGLGSNQQGIAEPVRAEGCVGRKGLGYKNPLKKPSRAMSAKLDLENLRTKLTRSKKCSYIPLVGTLPASITFCPSTEKVEGNSPECITLD